MIIHVPTHRASVRGIWFGPSVAALLKQHAPQRIASAVRIYVHRARAQ